MHTLTPPPSIVVECGGVILRVVVCGVVHVVSCVVWCCSCCVFVRVTCFSSYSHPHVSLSSARQVKTVNTSAFPLLASPRVACFLDGSFVTTTALKDVMPTEEFTTFLGADPSIKIEHATLGKVYIHIYVYVYVYMYMYIYTYICIHLYVYI